MSSVGLLSPFLQVSESPVSFGTYSCCNHTRPTVLPTSPSFSVCVQVLTRFSTTQTPCVSLGPPSTRVCERSSCHWEDIGHFPSGLSSTLLDRSTRFCFLTPSLPSYPALVVPDPLLHGMAREPHLPLWAQVHVVSLLNQTHTPNLHSRRTVTPTGKSSVVGDPDLESLSGGFVLITQDLIRKSGKSPGSWFSSRPPSAK